MRTKLKIIIAACVLAVVCAASGCSHSDSVYTPQEKAAFGSPGQPKPADYNQRMQRIHAYMNAHHAPGAPGQ